GERLLEGRHPRVDRGARRTRRGGDEGRGGRGVGQQTEEVVAQRGRGVERALRARLERGVRVEVPRGDAGREGGERRVELLEEGRLLSAAGGEPGGGARWIERDVRLYPGPDQRHPPEDRDRAGEPERQAQ